MEPVVLSTQGVVAATMDSFSSFVVDDLDDIICGDDDEVSLPSQVESKMPLHHRRCTTHDLVSNVPNSTSGEDRDAFLFEKPVLTVPIRGAVLRSKSFDCALFPRANDWQHPRDPPNTIVFISALQRQRRRSSLCSQITMTEAIDHSVNSGYTGAEAEEDDATNVSLDVRDLFESKVEYNFDRRSSTGASSNSTIPSSSSKDSPDSTMKPRNSKRPQQQMQRATSLRLPLRRQKSTRTSMNMVGHLSSKLNNSAKIRWLPKESSESSSSSSSEYEDFAQDSLKRVAVRTPKLVSALLDPKKKLVSDEEDQTHRVPAPPQDATPPRRTSTGVGRVA